MSQEKKSLVIVESPTKAQTIKKYLPSDYTVVASKGHVRDLPEDRIGIDVEHGFEPEYEISEGKEALVQDLKKKLRDSSELLLATDEDREGESISWHLLQLLKPRVPYRRMVFHEITRSAISCALEGGRDIDMNLVKAQEDRRIIDRLFGYEVSPILWKKLSNKKLSGGRVQSAGLRFIVEKELDRLNHKAASYYDIRADFPSFSAVLESAWGERIASGRDFDSTTGEFNGRAKVLTKEEGERIISTCSENPVYEVISVKCRESTSSPQPPFTTSTLQQAASSRLKLSSKETMRLAQNLFENGFITYMRTDSVNLSDECIRAARSEILREFGSDYLNSRERQFRNKSKNAQEAHEAIRPAGDVFRRPEETGLKGKELALYTLIWMRTIATQMTNARKSTTNVKIRNSDFIFSASGTSVLFAGYLKVYAEDRDEEEKSMKLPDLKEGEKLHDAVLTNCEHITTPPSRYNEASLIRKLEEQGIGRPSTYSTIISTLLDRGYVKEQDRVMIPTFTGFAVNACMTRAFSQLVDYSYTSKMEDELDKISNGEEDSLTYLHEFYYGNGEHAGLKDMLAQARASDDDYKTLSFPHFTGKAVLDGGKECSYSIKIGPYGTYIQTSLKKDDGRTLLVNIPPYELPGLMDNDDISKLISNAVSPDASSDENEIVLKKGSRGEYWQKGDKTCNVPKGRKKAEDYSIDEIEYLFSLPLAVARDEEGNEAVLSSGPFGFYLRYKDSNYKVYGVPYNMSSEQAFSLISRKTSAGNDLRTFDDYEGKSLSLRKGKFGPYLKWGDVSIRIPKGTDTDALSQEEAENLCQAGAAVKSAAGAKDGAVLGSYNGQNITLHNGRYGYYLKWSGKNYRMRKDADSISFDEAVQEIEKANQPASVLGTYKGSDIQLVSGRYGYYLKWNGGNYRISQRSAGSISLDDAIKAIEKTEEMKSVQPVVLGQYEARDVSAVNGRYGYYLKWGADNIALPSKYKKSVEGLTMEEAVEIIKRKTE